MKFSEYLEIMNTRGIGELSFIYDDAEYDIETVVDNFDEFVKGQPLKIVYIVNWDQYIYDSFDELLQADIFDGKTLQEVWQDIENVLFNGESEEEFLAENYVSTFAEIIELRKREYLEENGIEQWSHTLSDRQSYWYRFKFAAIGASILPVLLQIFPILGVANWYFELLLGGVLILSLVIAAIAMLHVNVIINYVVTDKLIKTFNGIECQTVYGNIRKITMRKYRRKQGYGRIQIYVKRGLSLNFRMVHVPDVEAVYKLITDNWQNSKNSADDSFAV